jgi:hypothetical protein
MIVSQPALLCLSSIWNNLTSHTGVRENHAEGRPTLAAPPAAAVERAAVIREQRLRQAAQVPTPQPEPVMASAEPVAARPAPVEQDVPAPAPESQPTGAGLGPLTANERRARAAALRALAFSRARRFDAAQAAFTDAATLDPALDLTRVPTFWSLERSAHEAAIAAYVAAGRSGDAAVLRAKVQSVYRPKPLRTRNVPATT